MEKKELPCDVCGQINSIPEEIEVNSTAHCFRCGADLEVFFDPVWTTYRTYVLCGFSLIFLLPGLFFPLLRIGKFGVTYETGIIMGIVDLFEHGQVFLALLIAVCSVLFPLLKLSCILFLCAFGRVLKPARRRHLHFFIEVVGRWGTLDVLLLAVLVAIAKLKGVLEITAGPGALIFSIGVFLSLAASQSFSPRILWAEGKEQT